MSRQDSTSSVGVSVSAPSSTGANTPSTVPNTPALSSHYANPSIPPTPSEFSGAFAGPFVRNPALALDSPARELGNLSLAPTPSPPLSERPSAAPADAAAGAPAGAPAPHAPSGPVTAAESVLARTSAGQQALREGVLPGAKALGSVPQPGPAPPATPSLDAAPGSSTAATPGDTRAGTPALPVPRRDVSGASTASAASGSGSAAAAPPAPKRPSLEPPPHQKKSVFGKLFGDKNSSSVSLAHSTHGGEAMERSAGSSTDGGAPGSSSGGANGGALLARRPSGGPGADKKREDKEREKREKAERKDREKRDKEARKEAERARSASRQRTPSQQGRARSESKGEHDAPAAAPHAHAKEGGGVMDFMRIKVQRKTSVTSRRSDDGRSDGEGAGKSQYGGSERSRGGQSNASLTKKYGVCDKVIVGKGATAVVRLAHKWDRSTEKLYAVKVRPPLTLSLSLSPPLSASVLTSSSPCRSSASAARTRPRRSTSRSSRASSASRRPCTSASSLSLSPPPDSPFLELTRLSLRARSHNVVETVDLVQDEQQHWCEVMEYCPGGDLYAVIKKGDLGPAEINSYFKQILSGVAYLHSMGVAHRDIKPENLLLDAKGHVKITDFGVSDVFRMCWERTTHLSKGLCGSEPYIAPEQFEQKGASLSLSLVPPLPPPLTPLSSARADSLFPATEYDARLVDVWAVAIVFYCCTFGELPWRVAKRDDMSFGPYQQIYRTSSSTPPPLSNIVPRECRSVIRRMLNPDPKGRATIDEVLADAWVQDIPIIPPLAVPH